MGLKYTLQKVPRVWEDLAHLQPSPAPPASTWLSMLHPSIPAVFLVLDLVLNNRHCCHNYDFISFNTAGLKCFKVGQIGNKEGFERELMNYADWTFV